MRHRTIRRILIFARNPAFWSGELLRAGRQRLKAAVVSRPFLPRKLPAWVSIALGFFTRFAGHEERIRHLYDVTREMGGDPEIIVGIIESVWFSVILVAGGVLYLIFVGESDKSIRRHPAWPVVAWSILSIFILSVAFVPLYGALEIYIREQVIKRVAGVPSGTPSDPDSSENQKPLFGSPRGLTPSQQRILYAGALNLKTQIPNLPLTYISSDNESYQYMTKFQEMLKVAGIQTPLSEELPDGDQFGVMIAVPDVDKVSEGPEKLRELLVDMDLKPKFISLPANLRNNAVVLFIGPRPMQIR
jgi:hypothetical protein